MDVVADRATAVDPGDDAGTPARSHDSSGGSRIVAPFVIAGLAVALTAAFLPLYFNSFQILDDEGFVLESMREFLRRGSLYHHTSSYYGPFFFSVYGAFFRLTNIQPTPLSGRLIMLVTTGLAACVFAATVYRATRSLAAAVLCEIASFLTLARANGDAPLHPASLMVLLVGVLLYCLSSNCLRPRRWLLAVAGFAVGALVLSKVNVGAFVVIALAIWLLLGSGRTSPRLRVAIVAMAAVFPFVFMVQTLEQPWTAIYALVVSVSLVLVCLVTAASAPLPNAFRFAPFAVGFVVSVLASVAWPLAHGTSLRDLVTGVFVRPASIANAGFSVPAKIPLSWPITVITIVVGAALVALWREPSRAGFGVRDEHWTVALGCAALLVISLAVLGPFASWLPAIVLIPALAHFAKFDPVPSSLLALGVAVAVLQVLQAYPVAGAQQGWSTVAVFVPCAMAIGFCLQRAQAWTRLGSVAQFAGVATICAFLLLAAGLWPYGAWHDYLANPKLGLPGTSLVRLDPGPTNALHKATTFLRKYCDTFYSVPPTNSFYIFTKIPSPTGITTDLWGQLDTSEQKEIVATLEAALGHERVCILRENYYYSPSWVQSSTGRGPLGHFVSSFHTRIGNLGFLYSVWARTGEHQLRNVARPT